MKNNRSCSKYRKKNHRVEKNEKNTFVQNSAKTLITNKHIHKI